MLMVLVANAAVINLTPISPDEVNNVRHALANAQNGDTIVLADGTYTENGDYLNFTKEVVLMAAPGANPIIQTACCLRFYEGTKAKIQGIKFDASQFGSYEHFAYVKDASAISIELEGCEFYNNRSDVTVFHIQAANHIDSIKINNCYFHDNGRSCLFFEASNVANQLTCDKAVITNSTFARIDFNSGYYASVIDIRNGGSQTALGTVIVDHCTFVDAKALNTDHAPIRVHKSTDVLVANSLFAWTQTYDKRATYLYGGNVKNCIVFNTTKDTQYWGHHSGPTFTSCSMADPLFRNAATGDYHLSDGSPALTAAEDGGAIGDPRWVPQMEYYLVGNMTEGQPLEAYKLAQNPENENEFILRTTLLAGDEFKIAKSDGAVIGASAWYPSGEGNEYKVTASGEYTVFFRPDGQGGEGWYEGFFRIELKDLGPWEAIFLDEELHPDYDSYITYDATMGKVVVYIRKEHYPSATIVQYAWGLPEDGKCYRVAMKMKANRDIAGVSLIWMNGNKILLEENETISLPANEVFVYDAICTGMANPANEQASNLIFGFKTVHPDDEIEIYDVVIEEADCPEPPTFYLAGDMTEWTLSDDYQFAASETTEDEYVLDTYLPVGAAIRVAGIQDGNETWYPNGIAGAYIVDAAHAGWVTVYFRPAGNPEWAAFGGYMFIDVREGLDKVEMTPQNAKFFRDGQLFILKDGRIYNVIGQKIAQ